MSVAENGRDGLDTRWQGVAEQIPHFVWMASRDGRVEYLNEQARDYLGWPAERPLDQIWEEVLHPDDMASVRRTWRRAIRSQTGYSTDFRLRHAGGEYRWHCGRGLPIGDTAAGAGTWIGTATDIDDERRSEAELKDIGDRLAEAQRLAHVGSWYKDAVSGAYHWSDELYRLVGHDSEPAPPDPEWVHALVHPDDAARVRAASESTKRAYQKNEFRVVLPGVGLRWLSTRSEPVLDPTGTVVGVYGTAQDVTERRLADQQLRFQADLLDAVGEAVIATDLAGTVIYWGPGAAELYGWSAEEAQGKLIAGLIPTVESSYDAEAVRTRLSDGSEWAGLIDLVRRDGSTFTAEVTRTTVHDAEGRRIGAIAVSCDVSARQAAQAELEEAHRTTTEALTLLTTLQAEAPVGFGFVDCEFRFLRVNHELGLIVGRPSEELIGRVVADVVVPELWQRLEPIFRHVLTTGQAVRNQPLIDRQTEDGKGREWLASQYPIRVDGDIVGIGMIVHDITDRLTSEGFRSAVMSQVVDGVYTQDCDGRLTYMNNAASKLLGWTEEELRGKPMHQVVHFQNSDGTRVGAADCALLTHGQARRLERSAGESFTRKDGSTFPVAYSSVPLRTGSTVEGVAVVFRDVSEPGSSPNLIRVLIVDSDRTTIATFQALLDRHEGIDVVAVATTSASAVDRATQLQPDVVLVNAELPDLDGLATVAALRAGAPSARVILMSDKRDDDVAVAGLEAGCAGVLDKSRAWVELVSAVRAAYHGETIISHDELQRVLSKVRGGGRASHLTDREQNVLACMRDGLSNAQVAQRLGVTANTVRNHVQRILYKLNVHTKLEAVVLTSREGPEQGRP